MKKYTFTTDALTVCGPHFPAGKSFPVRYELQDRAEMKRGQILPTIHAFVTLDDGKEIKIDIPGDDEYYNDAAGAMDEVEKAAYMAQEAPADPVPVEPVEAQEAPADPVPVEPVEAQEAPAYPVPVEPVEAQEAPADPVPVEPVEAQEAPADPVPVEPVEAQEALADPVPVEPVEAQEAPADVRTIPEKTFIGTALTGRGYAIIFDKAMDRTRVILSDPTNKKARNAIKAAGFYYSPSAKSWNRRLTFKAYRAACALASQLDEITAA